MSASAVIPGHFVYDFGNEFRTTCCRGVETADTVHDYVSGLQTHEKRTRRSISIATAKADAGPRAATRPVNGAPAGAPRCGAGPSASGEEHHRPHLWRLQLAGDFVRGRIKKSSDSSTGLSSAKIKSEPAHPRSPERSAHRGPANSTDRAMCIEDLYGLMEGLELGPAVPAVIRHRFDVARNALVYSWFEHELVTLAEQHSYGVVENACGTVSSLLAVT